MKIKKGDMVIVITGKDKGKTGKVLRAFPERSAVLVEGVHLKKRHERPSRTGQKGQVVEKPHPIHVSNVLLIDPKSEKPTRVGYLIKDGKKVRLAKKSGTVLS